jgi:hypothetical protein
MARNMMEVLRLALFDFTVVANTGIYTTRLLTPTTMNQKSLCPPTNPTRNLVDDP